MTPQDFEMLAAMLKRRVGLVLGPEKKYLVESRLTPVLRRCGIRDVGSLAAALRRGDEALSREVVEAMTTHETSFFRDVKPFDSFRHVILPLLLERRSSTRVMRILCCAASTGQEPYSLAILLSEEQNKLRGWRWSVTAMDISRPVLERARAGTYSQYEVERGLPAPLLAKYFHKTEPTWSIDQNIRDKVTFINHNLLDSLVPLGRFDVVFCRNVLIYFDIPTKATALDNIAQVIAPDGYLFLGSSETVLGICDRFAVMPGHGSVYRCSHEANVVDSVAVPDSRCPAPYRVASAGR